MQIILKKCNLTIAKHLQMIFCDIWKLSYLIPIFESGNSQNVGHYRGVCNQSSMAKLFDSMIYDQHDWSY